MCLEAVLHGILRRYDGESVAAMLLAMQVRCLV
jgi:hypothetical protein